MPTGTPRGHFRVLAACLLSILVGCTVAFVSSRRAATYDSARVLLTANRLERLIVDLEHSQLEFVATGDRRSLGLWNAARAAYPGEAARLRRLAAESNTSQGALADEIVRSADSYVRDHAVPLVNKARKDLPAARSVIARGEGRKRVERIREQFDRFSEAQHQISTAHERDVLPANRRMLATAAGTSGSLLVLLLLVGLVTRSGSLRRGHRPPADGDHAPAENVPAGRTPDDHDTGHAEGAPADPTRDDTDHAPAESVPADRTPDDRGAVRAPGADDHRGITVMAPGEAGAASADGGEQEAALRRVATLVARGGPVGEIFGAVAQEMGRALHADHAVVGRYEPGATMSALAHWDARAVPGLMPPGGVRPVEDDTAEALVASTRHAVRVSGSDAATGEIGAWARSHGMRRVTGCPVLVAGRVWGVLTLMSRAPGPPPAGTVRSMTEFAELAAIAVAEAEVRTELAASRVRLVDAFDAMRRRIERDLHDGAQQRLVSIGLELRAAEGSVPPGHDVLRRQLSAMSHGLADIAENLRNIARDLYPAILSKGGLAQSLRSLARRSAVPVTLDVHTTGRLTERIAVTVHHAVAEALKNAARHSRASEVSVHVHTDAETVRLSIRDDGIGGADPGRGTGLARLHDRVEALGGTMRVESPRGGGTSLHIRIPTGDA